MKQAKKLVATVLAIILSAALLTGCDTTEKNTFYVENAKVQFSVPDGYDGGIHGDVKQLTTWIMRTGKEGHDPYSFQWDMSERKIIFFAVPQDKEIWDNHKLYATCEESDTSKQIGDFSNAAQEQLDRVVELYNELSEEDMTYSDVRIEKVGGQPYVAYETTQTTGETTLNSITWYTIKNNSSYYYTYEVDGEEITTGVRTLFSKFINEIKYS